MLADDRRAIQRRPRGYVYYTHYCKPLPPTRTLNAESHYTCVRLKTTAFSTTYDVTFILVVVELRFT